MSEFLRSESRMVAGGIFALAVPFGALVAAYLYLDHLRPGLLDNWIDYSGFWGGNMSEVYSHWLDIVLMSGGAAIVAWYVSAEAFLRRSDRSLMRRLSYGCTVSILALNGVIALVLDGKHGEGTVMIVYPMFFIPILASTYYVLRRCATLLRWRPRGVIPLCASYVVLHTLAQLHYEPSETGGPSIAIGPYWLASVGLALGLVFVRSIRTGLFVRICQRFYFVGRKPIVWGSTILILLAITVCAEQVRKPRQTMAFNWLDELETRLSDSFVEDIKRDHWSNKADEQSKIPISPAVHALLADERIKGDNALRIYVPLNQNDYISFRGMIVLSTVIFDD